MSALLVGPDTSLAAAAAGEGSSQDIDLASLPPEILAIIHSRLLQTDPSLRSCLALEATCKHLRSTLHSNTRYKAVSVKVGNLATAQVSSFWSWIAAHGRRTDRLLLRNIDLRNSTPALCSQAGLLQAKAVVVTAAVIYTLEPLRGLLNLAAVERRCLTRDAAAAEQMVPACLHHPPAAALDCPEHL
jgi:hypothetical protein